MGPKQRSRIRHSKEMFLNFGFCVLCFVCSLQETCSFVHTCSFVRTGVYIYQILIAGSNQTNVCQNKIAGCNSYADTSDACESNYEFMNFFCQQTCGFCSKLLLFVVRWLNIGVSEILYSQNWVLLETRCFQKNVGIRCSGYGKGEGNSKKELWGLYH